MDVAHGRLLEALEILLLCSSEVGSIMFLLNGTGSCLSYVNPDVRYTPFRVCSPGRRVPAFQAAAGTGC